LFAGKSGAHHRIPILHALDHALLRADLHVSFGRGHPFHGVTPQQPGDGVAISDYPRTVADFSRMDRPQYWLFLQSVLPFRVAAGYLGVRLVDDRDGRPDSP